MNDTDYMNQIYESTDEAGFRVLTWYNAGTRNFYAKTPIHTPEDLKGMKIRVQQSPASVQMMEAFGAAASPMSFGEVYTAIQQGVIDGAENNELALTNNKHGEVAKYFSYNKHQMVPDMLIGNLKFLDSLSDEERQVFEEAARLSTDFAVMVVVGTYQVVVRYFFNSPSTVSEELLTYSFSWMALLSSALVFGKRDHMRMGFIADKLTGVPKKILEIVIELMIMAFSVSVMIWGGYTIMQLSMTQVTASLGIPMGVVYIVVPLSGVLIAIYSVLNIIDLAMGIDRRPAEEE